MKRTDLEKNLGLKIRGKMMQAAIPGRFAQDAAGVPDRRERRKLDQAAGLVPFAVKLHADLAQALRERAAADGVSLNELTGRLIRAGLAAEASSPKAPAEKAPAKKVAATKKAAAKKAATETASPSPASSKPAGSARKSAARSS